MALKHLIDFSELQEVLKWEGYFMSCQFDSKFEDVCNERCKLMSDSTCPVLVFCPFCLAFTLVEGMITLCLHFRFWFWLLRLRSRLWWFRFSLVLILVALFDIYVRAYISHFSLILQCFFLLSGSRPGHDESVPPGEKLLKGEWSMRIQYGWYSYIRMTMVLTVG